jgi:hypothetical protein
MTSPDSEGSGLVDDDVGVLVQVIDHEGDGHFPIVVYQLLDHLISKDLEPKFKVDWIEKRF